MRSFSYDSENKTDRLKSGIITAVVFAGLLLFLFLYKFTETLPVPKTETVSAMLINFGDNREGTGLEEPANQEGSLAADAAAEPSSPAENSTQIISEPEASPKDLPKDKPASKPEPKAKAQPEKILTGKDKKREIKTIETPSKKTDKMAATSGKNSKPAGKPNAKSSGANSSAKKPGSNAAAPNAPTGKGDGQGTAAVGNLLRGRGTKQGSQGDGSNAAGNSGDPLGGDGNGDSKIGVDRQLTGFIPGTMGRGGAQPTHSCTATGTITIAYTVDKAGNVVSARRSGGISDPCVVSTSIGWVKRYVKAERAAVSSTGTYRISF